MLAALPRPSRSALDGTPRGLSPFLPEPSGAAMAAGCAAADDSLSRFLTHPDADCRRAAAGPRQRASKQTASQSMALEGYEGHFEELGGYTVGFENDTADADLAPLFAGLPEDRCQCAHLGYVLRARSSSPSPTGARRCTRPARPTTRHRGTRRRCTRAPRCRVQPHRAAAADRRGRDAEPGGRLVLTVVTDGASEGGPGCRPPLPGRARGRRGRPAGRPLGGRWHAGRSRRGSS